MRPALLGRWTLQADPARLVENIVSLAAGAIWCSISSSCSFMDFAPTTDFHLDFVAGDGRALTATLITFASGYFRRTTCPAGIGHESRERAWGTNQAP